MNSTASPVIFGEVLFDCFPDGTAVLGGAPFNVAWHLHGLGLKPLMITSVGEDEHGEEVLNKMRQWGMDTSAVQINSNYPTGQVAVSFNNNEPSYDIVPDQAYDHVEPEQIKEAIDQRELALLYRGTLVARTEQNKNNINRLITQYHLPTFVDMNLRVPWWDNATIEKALASARWVKLNQDELAIVTGRTFDNDKQIESAARDLHESRQLELLIITLGEQGALCLSKDGFIRGKPVPVTKLVDTVGAGDSFSAVMIAGIIQHWPLSETLNRALAFASTVCGMRGATTMDRALYEGFLNQWQHG